MDEKTNKLSNDWVRCQSKSHPDRYYLFNKKTGETEWCAGNKGNNHLKTVAAKQKLKAPAQDRLKRLQNQLEKKRFKEAAEERIRNERKKDERKDNSKKSPPPRKKDGKWEVFSARESRESSETDTVVRSSKISSVQERLVIPAKKSPESPSAEKIIPPKKSPESPSAGKRKFVKTITPERSKSPIVLEVQPSIKTREIQSVQETQKPQKVQIFVNDDVVKYDENKNQRQPKEKGGFLSKIKGLCSNILNVTSRVKHKATDSEKLSTTSKPLFKTKKKGQNDMLRGISCDIARDVIQSSDLVSGLSPDKAPKVVPIISVPKESANDRLDRLRKSLKEQQFHQPPPSIPNPISADSTQSLNESEWEPMDWQPIAEDETINSPSTSSGISADLSTVSEHNDTVNMNITRLVAAQKQTKDWKKDHFYFVIDTNVFIEHPTFVEDLATMKLCDSKGTVIYIPYCVLQELDKLKIRSPSESTTTRTTRAIKMLNKAFEERNPLFQAQSAADESVHLIKVTSPDDSILNCCLQVKQQVDNLVLLTEDVNLQSKAMCNDILVSTKSDLISLH